MSNACTAIRYTALYLRISDDREGRELGVQRQEEDCRALAARLGYTIVRVYVDNDISASTRTSKVRPDYQQMLTDAHAGRFGAIIAYTSGRLTRKPREHEAQIELAEQKGVEFRYVSSPSFDLNTSAGRRVARILAANDTGEAEDIAERVTRARKQQAMTGKYGGGRRPYGFEPDGLTIREAEARIIRWSARLVLAKVSLRSIAKHLRDRQVPPASVTGAPWTPETLRTILLRPRNKGVMVYRGEEVGAAPWKPIIEPDAFDALKALLTNPERDTRAGSAPRWLGTGIYRCVCGATMEGHARSLQKATKPRYRCSKGGGDTRHVTRECEALDRLIADVVVERLTRPDAIDLITPAGTTVDLPALREAAAAQKTLMDELAKDRVDGLITRAQMLAGTERARTRLAEIEAQLAAAVHISPMADLIGADDVRARWDQLDLGTKRAIIKELMTVRVLPQRMGKGFDEKAIEINPKGMG